MLNSLSRRLVAISACLSLLLTGSWVYFCAFDINNALLKQKREDIKALLDRTTDYVDLYCQGLNTNLLTFSNTLSTLNDEDPAKIQTLMTAFHDSNPGKILTTAIVLEDGSSYSNRSTAMEIFGNDYFHQFHDQIMKSHSHSLNWSEPYISPLTLSRTVALYNAIDFCGQKAAVIVEININTMLSSILNTANESGLTWVFLSKENHIIATSDDFYTSVKPKTNYLSREMLEENIPLLISNFKSSETLLINNIEYILLRQSGMWDTSLIAISQIDSLHSSVRPILMRTVWLGIVHLLTLAFLLWAISHYYTYTIGQLSKKIKTSQDPLSLDFSEYTGRKNEIGLLAQSIDDLIHRVRILTTEREEILKQQRLLEIDVLQGQIHPHFLGNTMACIQTFIKEGMNEQALSSIMSLVKLINYSISRKDATATLQDELACVDSYITLRKLRVTYDFDYHVFVPKNHLQHHVPRLFLQPVIENSIIHGFAGTDIHGIIYVTSYVQNGKLFLCVDDNGKGASQERLDAVIAGHVIPSERSHGIGLSNVFKRLKLNDQTENFSTIMRKEDGGIRVILDLGTFSDHVGSIIK